MAVATYTKTGTKAATPAKLDKAVFGHKAENNELLKAAYLAYLDNARQNSAVVKTRGLVRGGGKKPWRQKGTGRARFGSSRNPIWRGGGIVFGPTGNENYSKQLNTKAKRQAVRQALTLAADNNKIIIIESVVAKEGKTAELAKTLKKIEANRNVLIVLDAASPEVTRASRNLQGVIVKTARYITVFDLLNADKVVITNESLKILSDWLAKEAK